MLHGLRLRGDPVRDGDVDPIGKLRTVGGMPACESNKKLFSQTRN